MTSGGSFRFAGFVPVLVVVLAVAALGVPAASATQTTAASAMAAVAAPSQMASAAAAKPGRKCATKGAISKTKKYGSLKCVKSGKKLVWKKLPAPPVPGVPATCTVTEKGFSYDADESAASSGFVLANSSPDNDATSVALTVNYYSGAAIVLTDVLRFNRIPAGAQVVLGGDAEDLPTITDVGAFSQCGNTPPTMPVTLIGGTAVVTTTSVVDHRVLGQFTNSYPYRLSDDARITYVVRDAAGAIVGGGRTTPAAPVPPGQSISWSHTNWGINPAAGAATAQFNVESAAA